MWQEEETTGKGRRRRRRLGNGEVQRRQSSSLMRNTLTRAQLGGFVVGESYMCDGGGECFYAQSEVVVGYVRHQLSAAAFAKKPEPLSRPLSRLWLVCCYAEYNRKFYRTLSERGLWHSSLVTDRHGGPERRGIWCKFSPPCVCVGLLPKLQFSHSILFIQLTQYSSSLFSQQPAFR